MIQLKSVYFSINNQKIFNNLNLHIKKNQKVLLKVPSGGGKSTLLKAIMGYTKVQSGDILIDNQVLNKKSVNILRQKLGYIGQNIVFSEDSVEDYINSILAFKSNKNIDYKPQDLYDYLLKFDLKKEILKKSPKTLSGGEKQRIALILVLLLNKEILLLDEITSGLDHDLKVKVIEVIKNLNKTIIVSSHDNQWLDYPDFEIVRW